MNSWLASLTKYITYRVVICNIKFEFFFDNVSEV